MAKSVNYQLSSEKSKIKRTLNWYERKPEIREENESVIDVRRTVSMQLKNSVKETKIIDFGIARNVRVYDKEQEKTGKYKA